MLSIPACAVTPKAALEWGVGDSQKVVVLCGLWIVRLCTRRPPAGGDVELQKAGIRSPTGGRDAVQLPPSGLDGKGSLRDEMVLGVAPPSLGTHCPLTSQSSLQSPVAS